MDQDPDPDPELPEKSDPDLEIIFSDPEHCFTEHTDKDDGGVELMVWLDVQERGHRAHAGLGEVRGGFSAAAAVGAPVPLHLGLQQLAWKKENLLTKKITLEGIQGGVNKFQKKKICSEVSHITQR